MQGIAQKVLADPGKYSIQQLQQGVQDGIIPAYIAIPIIQAKVQEQKQAQVAQSMQQAPAQARPPVAQQVMSEARGLEALPTNLPTQYAGGGIVAFDEGGEVPRFQVGGMPRYETPYDRMNRLNREREAQERAEREAQAQEMGIMPYGQQMSNLGSALLNAPVAGLRYLTSAPGGPGLLTSSTPDTAAQPAAQPTGAAQAAPEQPAIAQPPAAPPTQKDGIQQLLSSLGIGGAGSAGGAPGLGIKAPKFAAPGGESYEAGAQRFYGGYEKKAEALDKATEEKIAEAQGKVTGKAFDEYKKSLEKEALDAGAEKDQAKYMSMFKAGLAMMGGTSRFALENIGKGAMVGAEDYQAAVKDLKKAEKERQKEFALIEQARRAEDIGDRDKAVARLEKARETQDRRMQYIGEGIYKASNLDKAQAYDVAKTDFGAAADLARTDLTGRYSLAGHELSGRYGLAGHMLSAMGKERLTPYQELRLRMDAEKQIDPMVVRNEVAKSLNLTKVPAPGVDKTFDAKVSQLYERRIAERIYGPSTGAGATPQNPYAGFKLVP